MVYVQIKSSYLISHHFTWGVFNECISLKPLHCQRHFAEIEKNVIYGVSGRWALAARDNALSFAATQS